MADRLTLDAARARRFWEEMCARYGTRVISKRRALEMRISARLLALSGVMDAETFMSRYTTVWWRRIYPSFEVGVGDVDALWSQLVVCVHEHQHVVQYERQGFLPYAARYLASSRQRALLEAEAYGCNLELTWLRSGRLPDLDATARRLRAYGCDEADVAAARAFFEELAPEIEAGRYRSEAVAVACELFEELEILALA